VNPRRDFSSFCSWTCVIGVIMLLLFLMGLSMAGIFPFCFSLSGSCFMCYPYTVLSSLAFQHSPPPHLFYVLGLAHRSTRTPSPTPCCALLYHAINDMHQQPLTSNSE